MVLTSPSSRCPGWPELELVPQFSGCCVALSPHHTTPHPTAPHRGSLEKLYSIVITSRKWPQFSPALAPGDRALRETLVRKLTFSWHPPTVMTQSSITSLEGAQDCFLLCLLFLPAFIGILAEGCFSFCTYLYLA